MPYDLANYVDLSYGSVQAQSSIYNIQYYWPTATAGAGTNSVTYQNDPIYGSYTSASIIYQYQTVGSWNYTVYEESPEQKVAREEQEVKRQVASKRAEELLLLHLSDEQQKQYLELGYFETVVNDKTYRINKGRAGNVFLVEKGITKYKYCAHPDDYTPEQDAMLAQLLMLRTDEERFIKTANRTVVG